MSAETPLSAWLRKEMPRRGYPLGGPRSGGISKLAADATLPQATVSRLVAGKADRPEIDTLRKLGKVFGYNVGQMLIHAGLADPQELIAPEDGRPTSPSYAPDLDVYDDPDINADPRTLDSDAEREVLERVTSLTRKRRRELSRMAWALAAEQKKEEREARKGGAGGGVRDLRDRRSM